MTETTISKDLTTRTITIEDDLKLKQYELEKFRADRELRLEHRRYALERYKARSEHKFFNRHLGIIISASISLAAVLVSLGQVWVAKISKDKEIQVASLQKGAELERLDKQKEKEMAMQGAEQERQWNLSRAKFITENRKILFEGDPEELKQMRAIIGLLFPYDIAATIYGDLNKATVNPKAKEVWKAAQASADVTIIKNSGDNQIIPFGQWHSFGARVIDGEQRPIKGAKVAWQTVEGGKYTYVGETDQNGISTATNLFSFNQVGTYTQTATIVQSSTPVGFTQSDNVVPMSDRNRVIFKFHQQ